MSSKLKIKKSGNSIAQTFSTMSIALKVAFIVPLIIAVVLAVWLVYLLSSGDAATPRREALEAFLVSEGKWSAIDAYKLEVWCPTDIEEEAVDASVKDSQRLFVTRDKGKFPEIAYGVIVTTDEQIEGRTFDLENDPSGVLDVVTPVITEAFGNMINGAYPSLTIDISVEKLQSGRPVLAGTGEASVMLALVDPKDPENPYTEEATTNIYYNVIIHNGRPVIVWGTWDYSTYEGELRTKQSVVDGVTSLLDEEEVWVPIDISSMLSDGVSTTPYISSPNESENIAEDEHNHILTEDDFDAIGDLSSPIIDESADTVVEDAVSTIG